jgi:hypothetical protein
MGLAQRIKSESVTFTSAAGPSLLSSLWAHMLTEWADPDDGDVNEFDAGYTTAMAYCIAKIQSPYAGADTRIEAVLEDARARIQNGDD